ncbi:TolC family outer membrane protein [Shewanella sp. 202IG2-18]|uniref:TolC family outer membrane protein n=1 Tax=Parashewanella hymeniacidonis TaxID=2807618 RepID=UPI00195F8B05|nr:TolC family outer membrane protein [Parashewanella hymeniacidonis]MBM7071235.1 TolC family outer membrane protein [Parashewanella hymeniacidonis]
MDFKGIRQLKRKRIALALTACLLPTVGYSQSLEQAVAHTLDTNPDIRIAYSRFKVREEQHNQAWSGYLPSVDLTAGYGYEYTDSPATRRDSNIAVKVDDRYEELKRGEFGVSIRQLIFDGFYTSSESQRTSYETSAEQWTLFAAAEDIALDVAKVYVNYIHAQEVLHLSEKNLHAHKEIYTQIKHKTDQGLGSVADLSQITGRVARANANVIAAKNNFVDARAQFVRVVETEPQDLVVPVPDMDMMPQDLSDSLMTANEIHPVLKAAANDINAAKFERESAQSNYYPKFTLELSGNLNNDLNGEDGVTGSRNNAFIPPNDVGGHSNDYQAMVRMRYNLYAGGKDLAREKESAYRITESKETRERAHRQVVEGVHLSWNAYELLGPQKMFIREHVKASKQTQQAYKQQFSLGQRTLLDLLDTENELFESRKSYLQAEYDEIIAKYRVMNSNGKLLDSLRVTRPAEWKGEEEHSGGVK